jgi:hypothetical protein
MDDFLREIGHLMPDERLVRMSRQAYSGGVVSGNLSLYLKYIHLKASLALKDEHERVTCLEGMNGPDASRMAKAFGYRGSIPDLIVRRPDEPEYGLGIEVKVKHKAQRPPEASVRRAEEQHNGVPVGVVIYYPHIHGGYSWESNGLFNGLITRGDLNEQKVGQVCDLLNSERESLLTVAEKNDINLEPILETLEADTQFISQEMMDFLHFDCVTVPAGEGMFDQILDGASADSYRRLTEFSLKLPESDEVPYFPAPFFPGFTGMTASSKTDADLWEEVKSTFRDCKIEMVRPGVTTRSKQIFNDEEQAFGAESVETEEELITVNYIKAVLQEPFNLRLGNKKANGVVVEAKDDFHPSLPRLLGIGEKEKKSAFQYTVGANRVVSSTRVSKEQAKRKARGDKLMPNSAFTLDEVLTDETLDALYMEDHRPLPAAFPKDGPNWMHDLIMVLIQTTDHRWYTMDPNPQYNLIDSDAEMTRAQILEGYDSSGIAKAINLYSTTFQKLQKRWYENSKSHAIRVMAVARDSEGEHIDLDGVGHSELLGWVLKGPHFGGISADVVQHVVFNLTKQEPSRQMAPHHTVFRLTTAEGGRMFLSAKRHGLSLLKVSSYAACQRCTIPGIDCITKAIGRGEDEGHYYVPTPVSLRRADRSLYFRYCTTMQFLEVLHSSSQTSAFQAEMRRMINGLSMHEEGECYILKGDGPEKKAEEALINSPLPLYQAEVWNRMLEDHPPGGGGGGPKP